MAPFIKHLRAKLSTGCVVQFQLLQNIQREHVDP